MSDSNRVALVTGAATGIGLATARAFVEAGYHLVLADRDRERGEASARELNATFIACDVADEKDVARLHREIMDHHGRLDAACNNAGIEGEQAPTGEASLENFDRVLSVNLRGTFLCLREQMRLMAEQGHGAVVNMASVAGLVGFATLPAYCASKGGVVQLTKTAALEYATRGIRVNAVCPGGTLTPMLEEDIDEAWHEEYTSRIPLGRLGHVEDQANGVLFLASELSAYMTGTVLEIDGGGQLAAGRD